jgi:hypothetical protein
VLDYMFEYTRTGATPQPRKPEFALT